MRAPNGGSSMKGNSTSSLAMIVLDSIGCQDALRPQAPPNGGAEPPAAAAFLHYHRKGHLGRLQRSLGQLGGLRAAEEDQDHEQAPSLHKVHISTIYYIYNNYNSISMTCVVSYRIYVRTLYFAYYSFLLVFYIHVEKSTIYCM